LDSQTSGLLRTELCLVNVVHGELARAAHLDALMSVVHGNDTLASEKSKLKCGGKNAIYPNMTGGFALCLPNHVSQWGEIIPTPSECLPKSGFSSRWSVRILTPGSVTVKVCAIRATDVLDTRKSPRSL
jgi:hypothetical protein